MRVIQKGEYRPFNGKRLQQARQINRLTVEDLVKDMDVLPMEITNYENSDAQPDEELQNDLSMRLGFPVAFFHLEDPPYFPMGSLAWH